MHQQSEYSVAARLESFSAAFRPHVKTIELILSDSWQWGRADRLVKRAGGVGGARPKETVIPADLSRAGSASDWFFNRAAGNCRNHCWTDHDRSRGSLHSNSGRSCTRWAAHQED